MAQKKAQKPAQEQEKARAVARASQVKQGAARSSRAKQATPRAPERAAASELKDALAWLESHATKATRDGMARYGIPSDKALGVSLADIRRLAKQLGASHTLAAALWKTGIYEARLLSSFVDDPALVTPAQMDRWCRDFSDWAVTDTVCFHLFDRTPYAFDKVREWSKLREEFPKRAAFALLASLALHGKGGVSDTQLTESLSLIEHAAGDPRNFVKKGVSWALRSVGARSAPLHQAALALAHKLASSSDAAERWVGKDAVRDLTRPLLAKRIAARSGKAEKIAARSGKAEKIAARSGRAEK